MGKPQAPLSLLKSATNNNFVFQRGGIRPLRLGYSLSHAYGSVFDNPDLITAVVVGDGESETGPLATAWHSNKFINPVRDGAVLPILHLNGYKINNPTLLARISREELEDLFKGYGYTPYFVEGSDPSSMHQAMAGTVDHCYNEIREIQHNARNDASFKPRKWPMIILRSPKGWSGPVEVDGHKVEGSWRSIKKFNQVVFYALLCLAALSREELRSLRHPRTSRNFE